MPDNVLCVRTKPDIIQRFKDRAQELGQDHNDVLRFFALEYSRGRLEMRAVVTKPEEQIVPEKLRDLLG